MTLPPPGASQPRTSATGYRLPPSPPREVTAPTLMQYWRSDSRVVPGRAPARWAGRLALGLGLLAAVLFFGGVAFDATPMLAVATPLSTVALVVALVAIVAGIGRGLGVVGAALALSGNAYVWAFLAMVLD